MMIVPLPDHIMVGSGGAEPSLGSAMITTR